MKKKISLKRKNSAKKKSFYNSFHCLQDYIKFLTDKEPDSNELKDLIMILLERTSKIEEMLNSCVLNMVISSEIFKKYEKQNNN